MQQFLGAIAKLQRTTISFVMSVCLPAWNNSAPTGWIFMTFDSSVFSETSVDTIQVSLKSGNNNKYFTRRCMYIYETILSNFSWNEKCHPQKL